MVLGKDLKVVVSELVEKRQYFLDDSYLALAA